MREVFPAAALPTALEGMRYVDATYWRDMGIRPTTSSVARHDLCPVVIVPVARAEGPPWRLLSLVHDGAAVAPGVRC